MSIRKLSVTCVVVLLAYLTIVTPSHSYSRPDAFDDAERLYERFMRDFYDLKKLDKDELQRLVEAICEADEEERQSVAKDASSRVKDKVNSQYDRLEDLRDETLSSLKKVIEDENFKDKKSKAEDYKKKVEETWQSIERMTSSIRGSNHPVVSFMLEKGQEEHKNYQGSSSRCTVAEWSVGGGRADCIYASSCEVIELKPKNSRAISKGREQARGYADALNKPDELARLQKENSSFSHCTQFTPKVKCYTLCPEIDENGEFRSISVYWSDCG